MDILQQKYREQVRPRLAEELEIRNPMGIPRLVKVVVNMGFGVAEKDALASCLTDLGRITGQRPVVTRARKSISNFKLRAGMQVGAKVTLRGRRMYDFLQRLIDAGLPRIRDFRGLPRRGFDGRGNYTMGIRDQSIFPEIDPNNVSVTQGMDVTIVTSAHDDKGAMRLLEALGMPFSSDGGG